MKERQALDKQVDRKFSGGIRTFVRAGTALGIFVGFVVVIPLTLWFAWTHRSSTVEPAVLTLFCVAFAWLNVSILRWQRTFRKLSWSSSGRVSFGLGPRPDDPDELEIWQRGTHFRYSFAAVLLCMVAFGIVKWLSGE
jgi:hypothetical protein